MKPTNLGAALLALALPFVAGAGTTVDIEVLDRKTGRVLPVYWHDGDRHVAGEPGREYEIRLRNRGDCRVLAVTSVDGVNVITGRTASPAQSGYVLDPWGLVEIDGWRKSMDEVAAFYFTALPDSYAARTGRPDNVGVIGVALFRERARPMPMEDYLARAESAPPAAGASAEAKASSRQSAQRRRGVPARYRPRAPRRFRRGIHGLRARELRARRDHPHLLRLAQEPRRPRHHPVARTFRRPRAGALSLSLRAGSVTAKGDAPLFRSSLVEVGAPCSNAIGLGKKGCVPFFR